MKQHLRYVLKLFGERMFFNLISLVMIPVFIPIIGTFSQVDPNTGTGSFTGIGAIIFSLMVCSLYLGIAFDKIWKLGKHDRKSYATEKHYPLKGLTVAALSELPFLLFLLLLVLFPSARLRALYRVACIGTYMGFVPADRTTVGYGLVLLIMPVLSAIAYLVGYYKKPKDEKERLSRKIMYKTK